MASWAASASSLRDCCAIDSWPWPCSCSVACRDGTFSIRASFQAKGNIFHRGGSGMRAWRRLRDRQHAGVWDRLHEVRLAKLRAADRIDGSRVVIDPSSIRAVGSGQHEVASGKRLHSPGKGRAWMVASRRLRI
ncbi:hypothethical protein [Ralstonia solanacearum PSI07]|nr:hypothethical protein [Ralstonia solanacearum PSI07]